MSVPHIDSVIVGVSNLEESLRVWRDQLGLRELWRSDGCCPHLASALGASAGDIVAQVSLGWSGRGGNIHLLAFANPAAPVREQAGPLDACPKNLNMRVRDLPALCEVIESKGLTLRSPWVEYESDGTRYRDAHVEGPDATNIGLLEIVGDEYAVNDIGVGDLAACALTVEDLPAEAGFWRKLGFNCVLDRHFSGPAMETLIGLPENASLHMQLYGGEEPWARVELVSYGCAMSSHYPRARVPSTGAIGLVVAGLADEINASLWPASRQVDFRGSQQRLATLDSPAGLQVQVLL